MSERGNLYVVSWYKNTTFFLISLVLFTENLYICVMSSIYKGHILFTPTPDSFKVIENGYIAVDGNGTISGVYQYLPAVLQNFPVVDFTGKLIIPGMYDLHVHAPQYRNQGMAMDLELLPWLEKYTFPEEAKYADFNYARVMYSHFVHDMLRQGTLRTAVFATIHPEATKLLAHMFGKAGMGAMIGLVGMDQNCPEYLRNTTKQVIEDTQDIIQEVKDIPLVNAIVTPRFVPSCSGEMLEALGCLANDQTLPVQSHLSENRSEIAMVKEQHPWSSCYADVYRRYGLLGQTPTLMAHCVYTDGVELQMLKHGTTMVHCPTSNCNVATGIAPIRKFLNEGISVALGTDISGGHNLSIFRVMQYAQQMSKVKFVETNGALPYLSLSEVFYLATKSGGSFFGKVGSFESGYDFDALVIDDSALNVANLQAGCKPYDLLQRLERFIYLGDSSQIEHRFVKGKSLN